jgi:hypothetical protein
MPIRAEEELILCCARTSIEPPEAERLRRLADQGLDWAYVVEVCHIHGVSPLFYRSLKTLNQNGIPLPIMKQLQEHFYWNLAHNLRLDAELAALLDHFRTHGILAIPYKGPALATSVYGNLALRVFGDLDILIRKEDVQSGAELMASLGYQPDVQLDPKQMAAYMRTFYELTFTATGKASVELHWEIYSDHFVFPVAPLSIWHDKNAKDQCESGYRSIPPEKLLLVLCVHGAQHYWGRLSWICDIAELLRKFGDLDWDGLVKLATKTGGRRILFLGLSLAHELLDAPVPDQILHRMYKDRAIKKTVQIIRCRLFEITEPPAGILETCLFYVRVRERLQDKARLIFRTFSRPIPGQWDQLGHDSSCARLRNVTQHMRMGCSYGLGLVRQRWRKQVRTTAG